jgi:hypothetical protein
VQAVAGAVVPDLELLTGLLIQAAAFQIFLLQAGGGRVQLILV